MSIYFLGNTLTAQETGTFTDQRDGKVYKTVKIENQIWMAENFAYSPYSTDYGGPGVKWPNGNVFNVPTYGCLYNWKAAIEFCPNGWHMPSDAEWTTLVNNLGGEGVAYHKLTESVFSLQLAGDCTWAMCELFKGVGWFWTSTCLKNPWVRRIDLYGSISRVNFRKSLFFSVIYVKD